MVVEYKWFPLVVTYNGMFLVAEYKGIFSGRGIQRDFSLVVGYKGISLVVGYKGISFGRGPGPGDPSFGKAFFVGLKCCYYPPSAGWPRTLDDGGVPWYH